MKAITLLPEFAMRILKCQKEYEIRSWKTPYRGDLLICASNRREPMLLCGKAVCVCKLLDIEPLQPKHLIDGIMPDDGRQYYAWKLDAPYLIFPFKIKGKLHLFDVDDDLVKSRYLEDVNGYENVSDAELVHLFYNNIILPQTYRFDDLQPDVYPDFKLNKDFVNACLSTYGADIVNG